MRTGLRIGFLLIWLCASHTVFATKTVTIGIITDNPTQHTLIPLSLLQAEMQALMADEFTLQLPENKRIAANGTLTGVNNAIKQQLDDPEIDLIITLGLVSSQQIAKIPNLNKPVIAAMVLDRELQGFPYQFGVSGKPNLTYLTTQKSMAGDIAVFYDLVEFKHLAILMNPFWLETLPQLKTLLTQLERQYPITITVITALSQMPNDTDAVYVAPLLSYSDEDMQALAQQLIAQGLPSFASAGQYDVTLGLLAALGGLPEDKMRFARRLALDVQSILLGDAAETLNVIFDANPKMTINMQTARAIGFSPNWRYLLEAILLHVQGPETGKKLTLHEAMQNAVNANLSLQVNELFVEIAEENVDLARANLLPQLFATIDNQQVDSNDPLKLIGVAQNMTTGILGAQQSLYSDASWANFRISQYLEDAEDFKLYGELLNTLANTGSAYLSILRAISIKDVRRANLSVTEKNLELARMRDRVGFSSRADVLRCESQLALDQQAYLESAALVLQTQAELNRILNLPQDEMFALTDDQLGQFNDLINEKTLDHYVNNPYTWKIFQDFAIEETLINAPELGEIDSLTLAKEREQLANKRAFFVPTFDLEAGITDVLTKSGVGSDYAAEGITDTHWQVNVSATLPLLTGGARNAKLNQTGYEVEQLVLQNKNTQDQLEKRTRDILYQIGNSYPAIELSEQAANAAKENLALVTDRYEHGDVDITDLIDAQNNALSAQLDQAQARYVFLNDFISLLRSTGDLTLALDRNSLPVWFARVSDEY
ncbi:MAG: TolC family protein [Legionellales bacterium]|jgi:outer membrane protein TolC/ABC-type uncharacterized transport system substrate-binding protein